ncbi:Glucose/ribitol dehydrogenase [Cynara cardunculus var. scolymus]|uniref:Glucose/ribitol dehydrogenase n=1 Tax=Cynara cardunculus var. scolymus TaxID=59895 RepID=A0A124SD07_CYNCS|nr:Glucose/ribitol dehydrogenase [Cynara cardunculus var. scolymus]
MTWISIFTGKSGFAASSTAEDVTKGIDGTGLTAIVTVRNVEAGQKVKESISQKIPNAKLEVMELDISSLESVRTFASQYCSKGHPLNLLILNAGIMTPPFSLSKDNIELQFATNHVGNFLLTNLLLDTMKKTARESGIEGRIVILSSEVHRVTYKEGIRFDKINDEKSYSPFYAYGQSKLANALHANELSRRLQAEGANITANSLHPGVINTNLARNGGFFSVFLNGAATTCYVALHPQLKGVSGQYFADSNLNKASKYALDADLAKKLWDFSSKLTKSN